MRRWRTIRRIFWCGMWMAIVFGSLIAWSPVQDAYTKSNDSDVTSGRSFDTALGLVKANEGFGAAPYADAADGAPTIGYGTRLPLSKSEAEALARMRLNEANEHCAALFDNWKSITPARQTALLDMAYNMGYPGLKRFKRMIAAVNAEKWDQAAHEVLWRSTDRNELTRYAKQTGVRARRNAEILRTGDL